MLACKAGAPACVRLLLGAGADATLFDRLQERNALHYAGTELLRRIDWRMGRGVVQLMSDSCCCWCGVA